VRIIAPIVPTATDSARVDMVPAAFLALLLELGVHRSQIRVRDLHDVRYIAWTGATPETVRGAAMAHIQRPALDLALLAAVERMSGIRVLPSSPSYLTDPEERVIDATGCRAFSRCAGSSKKRIKPSAWRRFPPAMSIDWQVRAYSPPGWFSARQRAG
jgi:hypothetical protein